MPSTAISLPNVLFSDLLVGPPEAPTAPKIPSVTLAAALGELAESTPVRPNTLAEAFQTDPRQLLHAYEANPTAFPEGSEGLLASLASGATTMASLSPAERILLDHAFMASLETKRAPIKPIRRGNKARKPASVRAALREAQEGLLSPELPKAPPTFWWRR